MGKITVKGKTNSTAQFGCKIKVDADLWNATSQRCMGKSRVAVKTNKEIKELIGASESVSATELKNAFQGGDTAQMTLLQLFREHNEEYALRVGVNRNKKSYYNYTNLYRILSEYLRTKLNVSDVSLKQIDTSLAEGFDMFLRTDKRYQYATSSKQFRCLKVVLKTAVYRGLLPLDLTKIDTLTEWMEKEISSTAELTEQLAKTIQQARQPVVSERKFALDIVVKDAVFLFIGMDLVISVLGSALYFATRPNYNHIDNDLKYRYIKMKGEATSERISNLENLFEINRDNTKIRQTSKDIEDYERAVQEKASLDEQALLRPKKV